MSCAVSGCKSGYPNHKLTLRRKTTTTAADNQKREMEKPLVQELLSSFGISGILNHIWKDTGQSCDVFLAG